MHVWGLVSDYLDRISEATSCHPHQADVCLRHPGSGTDERMHRTFTRIRYIQPQRRLGGSSGQPDRSRIGGPCGTLSIMALFPSKKRKKIRRRFSRTADAMMKSLVIYIVKIEGQWFNGNLSNHSASSGE